LVMGLRDKTLEGGNNWPDIPWWAAYVIDWIFGWAHRGAWSFLPCDVHGTPRALPFA
jgi:hypothetical protein